MYWFIKIFIVGLFVNLVFWLWLCGDENVLESGLVIFVSNYFLFIDLVFLFLVVWWLISFLVKSEYFIGLGIVGWFIKYFFLVIN